MSNQDPKTKAKKDKTGQPGPKGKTDSGNTQQPDQGKKAFDQGLSNNSNTQTGTAQSGYDENNPKHPGGKQQLQPKVTNQENAITNSEEQNKVDEEQEPVEEQSSGNAKERTDPETDSPKKIPTMKGGAL